MQLDDWKQAWAAHGAKLERALAINEHLLRESTARKARFALAPYAFWRGVEVAVGVVSITAIARVLADHGADARYLVVAGSLAAFAVAMTALAAYLLVRVVRLDYARPVTAIQREIEHVKLVEYRAFLWAMLGGFAMWLPALLVLFEALTGVDALARVHLQWLAGNVAIGVLVLALGLAWSRRYVERPDLSPWARRVVDALSGRALRSVQRHLAELATFERGD